MRFKGLSYILIFVAVFVVAGGVLFPSLAATQITGEDNDVSGTLANPLGAQAATNAYAQLEQPASVFDLITKKDVNLGTWATNAVTYTGVNVATKIAFGGETNVDKVFVDHEPPVPAISAVPLFLEKGRLPGGLAGMVAFMTDSIVAEPAIPTDLALFMNDIKEDSMFATRAYAQQNLSSPGDFFKATTFHAWTVTRNIALAAAGLFLAIAALGIIFRQKLKPQVAVTVYNVLPMVPVVLVLIVLSYPLVALALNLMPLLVGVMVNLGQDVFYELTNSFNLNTASIAIGTVGLWAIIGYALAVLVNPIGLILSLPLVIILLALVIILIVGFFKFIFEYAKTYAIFVVIAIFLPLIALFAILPGKQGMVVVIFKKLVVNMIVIPIMVFAIYVGLGFIVSIGGQESVPLGLGNAILYVIGAGIFSVMLKFFIGMAIIWNGFKIRGILEDALQAKGSLISMVRGAKEAPKK